MNAKDTNAGVRKVTAPRDVLLPPRGGGKSAILDTLVEDYLDAGKTVTTLHPDGSREIRGFATARDVTPKGSARLSLLPQIAHKESK